MDDRLDWGEVLKPSPALTELLSCIDRTNVKPWILTNAYITHVKRVLKLLDIKRFFEGMKCNCGIYSSRLLGVTYCNYGQEILTCKPRMEMFQKAMMEAGVTNRKK